MNIRRAALAMPEDRGPGSLEAHIRKLIADLGLWGFHVRNSVGSEPGWPDWVILGPRGAIFAELKSEHGVLSVDQRRVGSRLAAAGLTWVVWRPTQLLDGTIARRLAAIALQPVLPPARRTDVRDPLEEIA